MGACGATASSAKTDTENTVTPREKKKNENENSASKGQSPLADSASPTGGAMRMSFVVGTRLAGKVALITGASKGIGRGIAVMFAKQGCRVIINYRSDPAGADSAVTECLNVGIAGCAVKMHGDVGKKAACEKLVEDAWAQWGKVDILVNNAGMEIYCDFVDVSEKDYDRVMDVNLKGPFFCTQPFARRCLAAKQRGTVVNISSVHEDLPFPGFTSYCASKGGMKMMTRNLSIELADKGIRVNNIAPGAIETPINASVLKDPTKLNELLSKIPLCRLGKPEDISLCAVYLASDESTYVTGTTIVVDGGLTWFYIENH